MNVPEDLGGLKTIKDGSVRIKAIGGPCHDGEIRVYMDEEWHERGTVTLHYSPTWLAPVGRVEVYRLHPPLSKRSAKWCLVHDVAASDEASK